MSTRVRRRSAFEGRLHKALFRRLASVEAELRHLQDEQRRLKEALAILQGGGAAR